MPLPLFSPGSRWASLTDTERGATLMRNRCPPPPLPTLPERSEAVQLSRTFAGARARASRRSTDCLFKKKKKKGWPRQERRPICPSAFRWAGVSITIALTFVGETLFCMKSFSQGVGGQHWATATLVSMEIVNCAPGTDLCNSALRQTNQAPSTMPGEKLADFPRIHLLACCVNLKDDWIKPPPVTVKRTSQICFTSSGLFQWFKSYSKAIHPKSERIGVVYISVSQQVDGL